MAGRVNERYPFPTEPGELGEATEIWGILNVTPDSFSDGGQHASRDAAIRRARVMLAEGADVVDVGGASSRPRGATYGDGAAPVDVREELARTVPVIEALVGEQPGVLISIDTRTAEVAHAALAAGARIVNDVSMGRSDALLDVCARADAELVLMHTREDGQLDETTTRYGDVVGEVTAELGRAVERAVARGVRRERVWIDPGLGFAKTPAQSMTLLRATGRLVVAGHRVLVGASRKSFLAHHARDAGEGALPAPSERLGASIAAALLAAQSGAAAVRVHDVRETRQALAIAGLATSRPLPRSGGAPAIGAPAIGALAIGALAVGAPAIGEESAR